MGYLVCIGSINDDSNLIIINKGTENININVVTIVRWYVCSCCCCPSSSHQKSVVPIMLVLLFLLLSLLLHYHIISVNTDNCTIIINPTIQNDIIGVANIITITVVDSITCNTITVMVISFYK